MELLAEWQHPPAEFSFAPFWFWNDELQASEIIRQLADFQAHGVDAFVIHPRVGLPRHQGWMSQALLDMMRLAIEQAEARGMWVILYDEGMYPSGSSSGQVVAENQGYQCRGMVRINLSAATPGQEQQGVMIGPDGEPALTPDQHLVAMVDYEGQRYAIVNRPIDSVIRGLHFIHEDADEPPEDNPPAADLLNPDAVACFIRLVYQRFYDEFGSHFGKTIKAIFTDEPHLLGRLREKNIMPGTIDSLEHVNAYLGYDFTPHLPALWDETAPQQFRRDYERALEHRLQATYYHQLYDWCSAHNIALTGHPAEPDGTAHLRFFHWPGQDIVWRYIEPAKESALTGRQSTQGKAASSMMLHDGRRRNVNEFCGAYGPETTFDEFRWLANWLLVRGCNLLIPHAFYYSIRGPRVHERPPDVGPNSPWWDSEFSDFAAASRRLCWLNTDSQHVCHVAILGANHDLSWRAARVCFENQIDFNYLDVTDLQGKAVINSEGIFIANQHYHVLIVDGDSLPEAAPALETLNAVGRLIRWDDDGPTRLRSIIPSGVQLQPACTGLRVRHVRKAGLDWFILFNEGESPIDTEITLPVAGVVSLVNPGTLESQSFSDQLQLGPHDVQVLVVNPAR